MLRPYQQESIDRLRQSILRGNRAPILVQPCGCHAAGHLILMYDGSTKAVEDVREGDLVMGPDSRPRRVQWTHSGQDEMVRVIPKKGPAFVVNAGHVLAVRSKGKIRTVTIGDWPGKSRNFRNLHKLFRVPVEYPAREHLIPPYTMGVLIGDGCLRQGVTFCTPDLEIVEAVRAELAGVEMKTTPDGKCPVWRLVTKLGQTNPYRHELKRLGLAVKSSEKHIPSEYLIDSRDNRLQLLAGLMDTDGSYSEGCYDYLTVSERLAKDVETLALSLGFWAQSKPCRKTWQGGVADAYRMNISGHLDRIPCRVGRKKARPRGQVKDPLACGFDLERIGQGTYYGFHLDGDHLYVDGNYMVHHNTGKTIVATEIIRMAREKGKKAVFYAPRRELVYQTSDELCAGDQAHGIIMAGERREWAGVQVASFDTVRSQMSRGRPPPMADLCIVDEAHLAISPKRKEIIRHYLNSGAIVIGLTATPARGDGRGLGEVFDDMIVSKPVAWFIENGYLVPARYYAPDKPDLEKVKIARGDYVVDELGRVVDDPKLIGNIVAQWHRLAYGKSTVVFCVNRKHSRHVAAEFVKAGVRAEHLDGETPNDERAAILERVRTGETTVLTNVYVASIGLDIPSLECAVLARPTKSISLYHQTVGRVMRISPGKTEAIVIDHAGAVEEHGLFSDPVPWSLESRETVQERKRAQQVERREPKDITCQNCHHVFRARRKCPNCGFQMIQPSEDIPYYEADLKEVSLTERRNRLTSWEDKRRFIGGLKTHASQRGLKPGWVAHAYRARFGVWPNDPRVRHAPPVPPSPEVVGHIKYLQIRAAKRRQAHG